MAFGSSSAPAFGSSLSSSSSLLGGATQPSPSAFGSSSCSIFGSSTPFGASSHPVFASTSTPAFGSTLNSTLDFTGSAFGGSSAPAFGGWGAFGASSSTPAFGASSSSTPGFRFDSTQAFGQSSSAFGSTSTTSPFGSNSPFGRTTSPFGGQCSSAFAGSQAPTSAFRSTGFGGQHGGTRVASYSTTTEADSGISGQATKLESISAMPVYKDKSQEELRWEDYQLGDKGGPLLPSTQSTGMGGFSSSPIQTTPFFPSQLFSQSAANPFSCTTPNSSSFAPKTSSFPTPIFGGTSAPPPFISSATAPSISGTSIFGYPQPSQLFSFPAPTIAQPTSPFGQNNSSLFGQQTASFPQPSFFNPPAARLDGSIFSTGPPTGFVPPEQPIPTPFQPPQAAPSSSGIFACCHCGRTQPVVASSCGGTAGMFGQNNFRLPSSTQTLSSLVSQAAPVTDSFETLRALQASFANLSIVCILR